MRSKVLTLTRCAALVMLVVGLGTAGCRQASGPVPQPDANKQGDIDDVGKDLMNVVHRADNGAQELQGDLVKFADTPAGEAAARELSQRLSAAIAASKLTEAQAGEIAQKLYVVIVGRQLSTRQGKALRTDIEALLKNGGVAESAIAPVGEQIMATQAAVTTVQKRWYELF